MEIRKVHEKNVNFDWSKNFVAFKKGRMSCILAGTALGY